MKRYLTGVLLVLMIGTLTAQQNKINTLPKGSKAPAFTLQNLAGEYIFLRDYCGVKLRKPWLHKTKYVVVLSFFATWCVPCQREIPHLMEVQRRLADQHVKFFLIDVGEKHEKVAPFIKGKKYTLPVLLDPYQVAAQKYGAHTLPRLVVIDKNGLVQKYNIGFDNKPDFTDELEGFIKALLQSN